MQVEEKERRGIDRGLKLCEGSSESVVEGFKFNSFLNS